MFKALFRILLGSGSKRAKTVHISKRPAYQPHFPPKRSNGGKKRVKIPTTDTLKGKCYVIDGDTIVIGGTKIRLAGIDAPELNHPWGKNSKFAVMKLCKGKVVTAHIKDEVSYDRIVAKCCLPDGTDIAAALVEQGLALDWPKFSGGEYSHLEPPEIRKKLWRAAAKQGRRIKKQN